MSKHLGPYKGGDKGEDNRRITQAAARQAQDKVNQWINSTLERAQEKSWKAHNEYLKSLGRLKRDGVDEK